MHGRPPVLYNGLMQGKCPICKVQVVWEENPYRPFCSERCKLIDLGAWATEAYQIPDKEPEAKPEKAQEPHGKDHNSQEG